MEHQISEARHRRMGHILLATNLLHEPLFTLYSFLTFILYKDLGASAFAISLLTALKPVVTTLSFYWSAGLKGRSSRLKPNAMWAGFWMRAPFLACPWIEDGWYVIAAAVNYMFFFRAGTPAWMELLKRNMKEGEREKSFSLYSGLAYAEGVVLSLAMGALLDQDVAIWKWLFFGAAGLGLAGVALVAQVEVDEEGEKGERVPLRELIVRPWRDGWQLVRERRDFATFQWGYMLAGFGIMVVYPVLPLIGVDCLGIGYMEMAAAVSVAKGLGFVVSTSGWARWFEKVPIGYVASAVFLMFGLFPLMLMLAPVWIGWLYVAYFVYGIGQAGSHLVWNMSGPVFAGKEESSRYTGVNVVMAGLRGVVGPTLGGWLGIVWGPIQVLSVGALICFGSGGWLWRRWKKLEERTDRFNEI